MDDSTLRTELEVTFELICGEAFDHDIDEFAPGLASCRVCGIEIVVDAPVQRSRRSA
jgi:hypothetical protein